jgi:hypothetical protein
LLRGIGGATQSDGEYLRTQSGSMSEPIFDANTVFKYYEYAVIDSFPLAPRPGPRQHPQHQDNHGHVLQPFEQMPFDGRYKDAAAPSAQRIGVPCGDIDAVRAHGTLRTAHAAQNTA